MSRIIADHIQRNNAADKADYPRLGYYWVPAAVDGSLSQVKVGYKDNDDPTFLGIQKKEIDNRAYMMVATPTRKLVITTGSFEPFKGKGLHVKHIGEQFLKEAKWSLYGASDTPIKRHSEKRDNIRAMSYVIQDSGGFQLATGVEDFVDPLAVARSHSVYADSGVSLDIPSSSMTDVPLVLASARMLVANNKVLRENTDKQVKLLNVCHGYNLQTRLDYLKIVTKGNPLDSLCIGGLRQTAIGAHAFESAERSTPIGFITHVLLSMLFTQKLYYHYHVLGVATDWQMALLSLASYVHQKLVTSDSATHSLTGKSGTLMCYASVKHSGHKVGRSMDDLVNARCSCPLCSLLQYEFPYRDGAGSVSEIHNGYILVNKAKLFDALVKVKAPKMKASELSQLLLYNTSFRHTASPTLLREFHVAVELVMNTTKIDDLLKFQFKKQHRSLFANNAPQETPANVQRFSEVLGRYEKYHKTSFRK